jgi:hypothetical protein
MKPRRAERVRTLLGAQIVFNNQNSTLDCQIRNISAEGAKLIVSSTVAVPEEFRLNVPQKGRTFQARLRWRIDDTIGVEFVGADRAEHAAEPSNDRVRSLEAENEALRHKVRELTNYIAKLEHRDTVD